MIIFNLKWYKKTLLWSSDKRLKLKYIFNVSYYTNTNKSITVQQEAKQRGRCLSVSFLSWFLTLTDVCAAEKEEAHCQRQSFLLSDRFSFDVEPGDALKKFTSISTKTTYRSRKTPVTSFLAKAQALSKLKKNCRKRQMTKDQVRKTAIPAKSSCQDIEEWHEMAWEKKTLSMKTTKEKVYLLYLKSNH